MSAMPQLEKLNIDELMEPYVIMVTNMRDFLEFQERLLFKIKFYEEWKMAEWQHRVTENKRAQSQAFSKAET